jgi:hypothetical protein
VQNIDNNLPIAFFGPLPLEQGLSYIDQLEGDLTVTFWQSVGAQEK